MKIREHRETLDESMETVEEIDPTMEAIASFINRKYAGWLGDLPFPVKRIKVIPYTFDTRIGWDTHIVVIEDFGVFGFTDGPVQEKS